MKNKTLLIRCLAVAGLLSTSTAANAIVPVTDVALINVVNTAVNTARTDIVRMLKSINDTIQKTAKNIQDNAIQVERDSNALKAEQQRGEKSLPENGCATGGVAEVVGAAASSVVSNTRGYGGSGAYGGRNARNPLGGDKGLESRVNEAPRSQAAAAASVLETHASYCNSHDAGEYPNLCRGAAALPDADVQAASLFYGAGSKKDERSYTFNAKQIDAAMAYLKNVNDSLSPTRLTAAEARKPSGRAYLALQAGLAASTSMAYFPSELALAERTPLKGTQDVLALLEKSSAYPAGGRGFVDANDYPDGVSRMDLLRLDVARRYENPKWYVDVAGNVDSIPKEQIFMQALALNMQFRQIEQMERIEVLLGQLVARDVNRDLKPRLQAQYQAVKTTK
ncbi:MAG: conjugal transfer protein TraW [Pseudomonadota bacterium]